MIKDSKFQIVELEAVVFLGAAPNLEKLILVNDNERLTTHVVTSPAQEEEIPKKINYKSFSNLDRKFESYISENFDVSRTLFVSLGARWIFNERIINDLLSGNLVNFHGSRLPLDAGGGGFSWRIMRGDRIDNQLVHLVDKGIDTGPILYTQKSLFPRECKVPADFEKYHRNKFVDFYQEFTQKLKRNTKFLLKYQVDYLGRYNPRLATDISGWVDWSWSSLDLTRFIDAFDSPYLGVSTCVNEKRVRLKQVHLHGGEGGNHPFMAGIVVRHDGNWLVVSTADCNMLLIEEVVDENEVNIRNDIKVGDRFYTPSNFLEEARSSRIKFSSKK